MNPTSNFRHLMGNDSEFSEDEGSLPVPSTSSDHSNPSVDSTSSVDSMSSSDIMFAINLNLSSGSTPSVDPTPPVHPTSPVPSTSHDSQENYDNYRSERLRRLSFRNWPVSSIDSNSLAAAGFYYTGEIDRVRCFECQVEISHWSEGQNPMQTHEMSSPECRFIRNKRYDNESTRTDSDIILRIRTRNRSLPYSLHSRVSLDLNYHRCLRLMRNPTAYELSRLGLKGVKKPEKLGYASYAARLNSFKTWPTYMTQKSDQLADAGFYYTGIEDFTNCYHCGVRIGNWKPGQDPWEQHAISSRNCFYLLTIQGWEFVNNLTGQELDESSAPVAIEITVENTAKTNSENDTSEMTLKQKIAALEKENRALKDARLCKVCVDEQATITFLPCGHLATCHNCSQAFTRCIICRSEIEDRTRTSLA